MREDVRTRNRKWGKSLQLRVSFDDFNKFSPSHVFVLNTNHLYIKLETEVRLQRGGKYRDRKKCVVLQICCYIQTWYLFKNIKLRCFFWNYIGESHSLATHSKVKCWYEDPSTTNTG